VTVGRLLALAIALSVAGCGDDTGAADLGTPDLMQFGLCPALACEADCPSPNSHCIGDATTKANGGCTHGQSTCGARLTGDCGFASRCLSPFILGTLFVAVPEGGCAVERVRCDAGCADSDADAGADARCR
jgi:hypothetical protein